MQSSRRYLRIVLLVALTTLAIVAVACGYAWWEIQRIAESNYNGKAFMLTAHELQKFVEATGRWPESEKELIYWEGGDFGWFDRQQVASATIIVYDVDLAEEDVDSIAMFRLLKPRNLHRFTDYGAYENDVPELLKTLRAARDGELPRAVPIDEAEGIVDFEDALTAEIDARTSAEVIETIPEEYLIWFKWISGGLSYEAIYVDDRGDAFHFSREGNGPETLLVYRNVRLSPETLVALLSVRHASAFAPGFSGSETLMTAQVISSHKGNCSAHLCSVHNWDLLPSIRKLKSALEASEARSVESEFQFVPDDALSAVNPSEIQAAWNLDGIRPTWIAEAWDRAGERMAAGNDDVVPAESPTGGR